MTIHFDADQDTNRYIRCIVPAFDNILSYGQAMDIIANTLRWGGLAFGPSDCGYAMWALPTHPSAIRTLDGLLDHTSEPIPLSVASVSDAIRLVKLGTIHLRLASGAWPGGLTLVGLTADKDAQRLAESVHAHNTLGVRVSRSDIERQLVTEAGMALTSAAIRDSRGLIVDNYDDAHDIVLDGMARGKAVGVPLVGIRRDGRFTFDRNSTVAEIDAKNSIHILREGTLDRKYLLSLSSKLAIHEYGEAT